MFTSFSLSLNNHQSKSIWFIFLINDKMTFSRLINLNMLSIKNLMKSEH